MIFKHFGSDLRQNILYSLIKEEIKLLYGEDEVGSRNICQVIGMQYGGLLNDVCKNDDRKVFTDWLK